MSFPIGNVNESNANLLALHAIFLKMGDAIGRMTAIATCQPALTVTGCVLLVVAGILCLCNMGDIFAEAIGIILTAAAAMMLQLAENKKGGES